MINYTPVEYLKIDIANQYGLDKKSFPQRIAWVNSVKDLSSKAIYADKPAQYMAALLALEDAENGVATGHLVGLDACSSGISILGILSGCHVTSANTGVTGLKRMDMYNVCTVEMQNILDEVINVDRSDVKQSQMTHFYGSKAMPKSVFGDETDELDAFYEAQEIVAPGACYMMEELLGSWQPLELEHSHTLPDAYNSIVPVLQKMKSKIEIDELDHATLTYIYTDNIGTEKGLAVAANITHAIDGFLVRETVRRCNYDRRKLMRIRQIISRSLKGLTYDGKPPVLSGVIHPIEQAATAHQFISLRGTEFVNKRNVFNFSVPYRNELMNLIDEVLTKPTFEMLTIHDEFKCHPNHMNDMRKVYQSILAELADSRVGEQIIREVREDPTYILDKLSDDLGNAIMESEYFLS